MDTIARWSAISMNQFEHGPNRAASVEASRFPSLSSHRTPRNLSTRLSLMTPMTQLNRLNPTNRTNLYFRLTLLKFQSNRSTQYLIPMSLSNRLILSCQWFRSSPWNLWSRLTLSSRSIPWNPFRSWYQSRSWSSSLSWWWS